MRQNDELLERYRVVNSQYEEKQQALNSLQEKNLTTRTREQLEEELLEKIRSLPHRDRTAHEPSRKDGKKCQQQEPS